MKEEHRWAGLVILKVLYIGTAIFSIICHTQYGKLIAWGHTHLFHSFIIHAFSLKLLKDLSKSIVFPTPHSPLVYGEEHWTIRSYVVCPSCITHCYPVVRRVPLMHHPLLSSRTSCAPHASPIANHSFLWFQFWIHIACQLLTLT